MDILNFTPTNALIQLTDFPNIVSSSSVYYPTTQRRSKANCGNIIVLGEVVTGKVGEFEEEYL